MYGTGVGFNSRNNFANLCIFAKVSVPLQFMMSLSWDFMLPNLIAPAKSIRAIHSDKRLF